MNEDLLVALVSLAILFGGILIGTALIVLFVEFFGSIIDRFEEKQRERRILRNISRRRTGF